MIALTLDVKRERGKITQEHAWPATLDTSAWMGITTALDVKLEATPLEVEALVAHYAQLELMLALKLLLLSTTANSAHRGPTIPTKEVPM